jgi:putative iron-dependent peroxidase
VARETPTFIYGDSLDMTGFQDGAGNPAPEQDVAVAIVPDGRAGEGGSFIIAQRWVHDLDYFNSKPVAEQEGMFGRTKGAGSDRLAAQPKVQLQICVTAYM